MKINLSKIAKNSKIISDRCAALGISVVGVTKCVLGDIRIAETLKSSGIDILGDSRLANLKKLRDHFGPGQPLIMLRTPMLSEIDEVTTICDISMNTQLRTVREISRICERKRKKHNIIVMVETDDQREGVLPNEVIPFCREVLEECDGIRIWGLGTNARCISSKKPTAQSVKILIDLKRDIKNTTGIDIPVISGGNSSIWSLIEEGIIPSGVNQVRIGEAILLGHETADFNSIKGTFTDCFILEAEVIEVKRKGSNIYRIILGLGLQDVSYKNISCINPNLYIIDQSSDHTVLGIKEKKEYKNTLEGMPIKAQNNLSGVKNEYNKVGYNKNGYGETKYDELNVDVGSIISFNLNYFGLLSSMTSPFVEKMYIEG